MRKLTSGQQEARLAILRDVERSGGADRWSHLHSHGHHFQQVCAAVNRGDLRETLYCHYELTASGRAAIEARTEDKDG